MHDDPDPTRRQFLTTSTAALTAAVAGCSSGGDPETPPDTGCRPPFESTAAARRCAERRREELTALDDYPQVVNEEVIAAIDAEINAGRSAADLGRSDNAREHFKRAVERALEELVWAYRAVARFELDVVERRLDETRTESCGAAEEDRALVAEKLAGFREQVATAPAEVDPRRSVFQDVLAFRREALARLEPTLADRVAETAGWAAPVAVIATAIAVIEGAIIAFFRGSDDEEANSPTTTEIDPQERWE